MENFETPPLIQQSYDAFRKALLELLKTNEGEWVGLNGDICLGFAKNPSKLYQKAFKLGLTEWQFIVHLVVPEVPEEMNLEDLLDL